MSARPARDEAVEYYFTYIDQVAPGDINATLATQGVEVVDLLRGISDAQSLSRYAPDKWSIRDVLGHINDTERIFTFRALWIARALGAELPGFEQDEAVATAGASGRSWQSHIDEFVAIRSSSVALFGNLPAVAWDRRGVASGNAVTVRALAWITAGHVAHHCAILRDRYLR